MADFIPVDDSTYKLEPFVNDLETVVGDEKQPEFYPRLKIKRWENDTNFSVGLLGEGGTSEVVGDKIIWTKDDTQAVFYKKEKRIEPPATTCDFVQMGPLAPDQVPGEHERSAKEKWVNPTIVTYWCNQPAMMFAGTYYADDFIDWDKLELPKVRAAWSHGNPYYMDEGLPMIEFHWRNGQLENEQIMRTHLEAVHEVLKEYGVTAFQQEHHGYKSYVMHEGVVVKIGSPQKVGNHLWTYINVDCDYNRTYTYYKPELETPKYDPAYGLKTIFPEIDFTNLVEDISRRWMQKMGLAAIDKVIQPKNYPEHYNEEWVR